MRKNEPAYFKIGHYEVSKCWDIAFQQMKQGETARVFCPGFVDQGGNINQYHQWGEAYTHIYSNRTYEFEMVECTLKPKVFKTWFAVKEPKVTQPVKPAVVKPEVEETEAAPLEPVEEKPEAPVKPTPAPKPEPYGSKIIQGKHFVFSSSFKDSKGNAMVMAAKEEDKYPRKQIGVNMAYIAPFKVGDKFQQWYYDTTDHIMYNVGLKEREMVLQENADGKPSTFMLTYSKWQPTSYNEITGTLTNDVTKNAYAIEEDQIEKRGFLQSKPLDEKDDTQKWRLTYDLMNGGEKVQDMQKPEAKENTKPNDLG